MESVFYKYLISHGINNLIEVDGLVYAAMPDILRLWASFAIGGLIIGLAAGAALILAYIIYFIHRKKKHAADDPPRPSGESV